MSRYEGQTTEVAAKALQTDVTACVLDGFLNPDGSPRLDWSGIPEEELPYVQIEWVQAACEEMQIVHTLANLTRAVARQGRETRDVERLCRLVRTGLEGYCQKGGLEQGSVAG